MVCKFYLIACVMQPWKELPDCFRTKKKYSMSRWTSMQYIPGLFFIHSCSEGELFYFVYNFVFQANSCLQAWSVTSVTVARRTRWWACPSRRSWWWTGCRSTPHSRRTWRRTSCRYGHNRSSPTLHDRPFRNFGAYKSVVRRSWAT